MPADAFSVWPAQHPAQGANHADHADHPAQPAIGVVSAAPTCCAYMLRRLRLTAGRSWAQRHQASHQAYACISPVWPGQPLVSMVSTTGKVQVAMFFALVYDLGKWET